MTTWQPIETAPKDGTSVLLCSTADVDQSWPHRVSWWDSGPERWAIEHRPRPDLGDGWTETVYAEFFPTHWQPLPAPPSAEPADPKSD
jgi:hypothetical protein